MFKFIRRIFYFISFFLLFFVVKEFLAFYSYLKSIDPIVALVTLSLIGLASIYFIIIPIFKILSIPVNPSPTTHKDKETQIIAKRINSYKKNPYLKSKNIDVASLQPTEEDYHRIIVVLNKESELIRRKYVNQVFYRTGIVQNGFIDALLILSSSVAMVKELFTLYNGRVSNRDLWKIARQVYYSMLIGGSEAAEYATDEVFSKLASESIKNIPFIDKIMTSMADGLINAALVTRVALITENYCTKTYVSSYRELYPSAKFIIQTAKSITMNIINNITGVLKGMASEKSVDVLLKVGNPVGYIFEKAIDVAFPSKKEEPDFKRNLKTGVRFIGNPVVYGIEKLVQRSRLKRKYLIEPEDNITP
jgi:hypothetical protein